MAGTVGFVGSWLLLVAAATVFAILGSAPAYFATLAIMAVVFTTLSRRRDEVLRLIGVNQLATLIPEIFVGALTAILAVTVFGASRHTDVVIIGLTLAAAARAVGTVARDRAERRRKPPVRWLNLRVPGLRGDETRADPVVGPEWLFPSLIITAGIWVAEAVGTGWVASSSALVAIAVAAGFAAVSCVEWVRSLSRRTPEEVRELVRQALTDHSPVVAVYFEGPRESTHALNVWMPTLNTIRHRSVVIVRDAWHLDADVGDVPILYLPKSTDVEYFAVDSIKVALYPTNVAKNNHLIRLPGIFDVFVGHGDSDKGGSANPISRIYDEVWVAGRGARDRYRRAQVGVREEQVREVGRPQLLGIDRAHPDVPRVGPLSVLYAPTREGFYAAWSYSSVAGMGERVIRQLLSQSDVAVTYKPHPATGSRDAATAEADRLIRDLITDAGAPHRIVESQLSLTEVFNQSDVLISDISSVVSDFISSRKPYIVCNTHAVEESEFRHEFPSTAAAYLLEPSCETLPDALAAIRGTDPLRGARDHLAQYLLGDDSRGPIERFEDAIDAAVGQQLERDSLRGLLPTDEAGDAEADDLSDAALPEPRDVVAD
ncbi:MAG: CDP-glycerol glycerophosphotransferase family protein [Actinomycetota bacterium]|nr:CDP-glycerol glycerophosphotransferase family protein [Actinomycetota bacterium]